MLRIGRNKRGTDNGSAGFTLIELAVTTMIIGILFASLAYPYSVWLKKQKYEQTVDNLEQMALVVSAYRSANGHYPCPAPLDLPRTDPNYGFETDCSDEASYPVGSCTNGICAATSNRQLVDIDVDNDGTVEVWEQNLSPRVRIGSIPFRDLNLSEDYAHDGYGSKILYAVTEVQARDYPMNPEAGGITVEYEEAGGTRQSRISPADSADFVVLSHGQDKVGSYRKSGVAYGVTCDENKPDGENCDHINGNVDSVFFLTERAEGDAGRHDDMVLYQMPLNAPVWARSTTNDNDIYAIKSLGPEGKIGGDWRYNAEPLDPDHPARMWVGGNVFVAGDAHVEEFCNQDEDVCFPARMIGGEGISCDTGLMIGIEGADAECSGTTTTISCPGNQVVQALSNGALTCQGIPCQAQAVSACSMTLALLPADDGETQTLPFGTYGCMRKTYLCNAGVWEVQSSSGMCACTPSSTPYTEACEEPPWGGPCTGQKTYNTVTVCSYPCTTSDVLVSDTCSCPPAPPGWPPPTLPPPTTPPPTPPPTTPPPGPGPLPPTQPPVQPPVTPPTLPPTIPPTQPPTQPPVTPPTQPPVTPPPQPPSGGTGDPPCTGGSGGIPCP